MHKQTKAFLDDTITNPDKSLTDAYIENKNPQVKEKKIATNSASRLYNRPTSQSYLKKHVSMAKKTKIELLSYASKNKEKVAYASLANTISEQILDRALGKPIQSVQTNTTNLNINIEASKELADNFTEFLKQSTAT